MSALKASLERLGRDKAELYQIHWPNLLGDDAFLEGLARCYEQGLAGAVGVSNFSEIRLRNAVRVLDKRGVKLASNQVNYSLVYREPETNGVLAACEELGVGLIAYSPLAQGTLTGKYSAENPPPGPRRGFYNRELMESLAPLLGGMKAVAEERGASVAQVALAYLTANPIVVPIPGVKNAEQVCVFSFSFILCAVKSEALIERTKRSRSGIFGGTIKEREREDDFKYAYICRWLQSRAPCHGK